MSSWALDVDKTPPNVADTCVEASRWQRHAIYRVPAFIRDVNPKAYRPQVVSLGPFHHGRDGELLPMEKHKRRALRHLLWRAKRPLEEFAAAVEDVAEQLESAYLDLGDEWRGADGRERFLEMMIVDGCFLLEVMKATEEDGRNNVSDYAPNTTGNRRFAECRRLCRVYFIGHSVKTVFTECQIKYTR